MADGRTILDQASEAAEVARTAFATGDNVTGIAAITLAAQLVQLAKLRKTIEEGLPNG
jgi:hypothetical protein